MLNISLFRLVDKNNFYAIHVPVNVVGVFMFLRLNIFLLFFSVDKLYVLSLTNDFFTLFILDFIISVLHIHTQNHVK